MIHVMPWFCLRMHAAYRCRHAGACCRADWEIPAETHVLSAVDASNLRRSAAGRALMAGLVGAAEVFVPRRSDRTCMFFEPRASGSCAIHREAGEDALPSACRHFPRELLIDPRGTFVSLSHYCPTAAGLLQTVDALEVVEAVPPLRIGGPIEGLDARDALPPLVRPGILGDLEGYAAWEAEGLAAFARADLTAGEALDCVEALTGIVREWRPGASSLRDAVAGASPQLRPSFDPAQTRVEAGSKLGRSWVGAGSKPGRSRVGAGSKLGRSSAGAAGGGPETLAGRFAPLIAQHIPEEAFPIADYEARWAPLVEGQADVELVMKNYLAARLFANWIAYQGQGLRTIVEWLRACHAVIRNEIALRCMESRRSATVADALAGAGRADLLLVHTIDSQKFADAVADAERRP